MLNEKESIQIKAALRELDPMIVNRLPMVSLQSVLRILTNYRTKNDNWDLLITYKDEEKGPTWWIGPYDAIAKAKQTYEAELDAKKELKKLEDAKKKEEKVPFLAKLFGKKPCKNK